MHWGSRSVPLLIAVMAMLAAAPARAGDPQEDEERSSVNLREGEHNVRGVAMMPLRDTNIDQRDIPPLLIAVQDNPYSLDGVTGCARLHATITELDEVLGPDVDEPSGDTLGRKRGRMAAGVAKSVLGSFIPFRGVIRQVSGAAEAERRFHAAVEAGLMRRAFLKGYARARRCGTERMEGGEPRYVERVLPAATAVSVVATPAN